MNLYFENWSDEFFNEAKKTKFLRLVSPFVQYPTIKRIMDISTLKHVQLITRLNERDFASGVSSLSAIKLAVEKGAAVYGIRKLHSKVYLFDRRAATITSSNLTESGLSENIECGICLNDARLVDQLIHYFDDMVHGLSPVTLKKCDEIQTSISSKKIDLPQFDSLTDHGARANRKKNGIAYYVKFFGTWNSREPRSYSTRKYVSDSGCHYACTFPQGKAPRQVRSGDIVFIACMISAPNDYAIYGTAEAIKHDDSRDRATADEIKQRPWKKDWPIYLRVRNCEFIDGTMQDCPMLWRDALKKLGPLIFKTTSERTANGEKGVDPKMAIMQKAYIRLSDEAGRWIYDRFQNVLRHKGAIDKQYLDDLPK